jgi:predicted nucleotidyltransferase
VSLQYIKKYTKKYIDRKHKIMYNHIYYGCKSMTIMEKLRKNGISLNYDDIVNICRKYYIIELSIFGSSIRNDFNENSDIDILVSFAKNSSINLFDIMNIEHEFAELLKRKIDIIEKESLRNPIRKNQILSTREIIYAA